MENFNISENNIISVQLAKVLGSLQEPKCCTVMIKIVARSIVKHSKKLTKHIEEIL